MRKRCTRGNPSEYEGRDNYWDDGKVKISANDTEGVVTEGTEKAKGKEKSTEEEGLAVWDRASTKERVPGQESEKDFVITKERLWDLHRVLNYRKGRLSSTNKKNTEVNTKVHDLNQKTMQALDVLAEEYEIFEETMEKVTHETEDGDM